MKHLDPSLDVPCMVITDVSRNRCILYQLTPFLSSQVNNKCLKPILCRELLCGLGKLLTLITRNICIYQTSPIALFREKSHARQSESVDYVTTFSLLQDLTIPFFLCYRVLNPQKRPFKFSLEKNAVIFCLPTGGSQADLLLFTRHPLKHSP